MTQNATDICRNCGDEFANHDYVKDSITQYKCKTPYQEGGYGYFCGGDPRKFSPDGECCSPAEIENHKRACNLWDEAESRGETLEPEKCPSGWIYDDAGKAIAHVLRAPYGIGIYSVECDQFYEPRETDDEETEDVDSDIDFEGDDECAES